MIRSAKLSLKFANIGKKKEISDFVEEYRRITQILINKLWPLDKIPCFLPKEFTKIETTLAARAVQAAGKQASGIVRGTKQKNRQRQFILEKLKKEGNIKGAKRLQKAIDLHPESKPDSSNINPELDSRFFKLDFGHVSSFDGWLILPYFTCKLKIKIPFRKTKPFNEWNIKGKILGSIRLSKTTFSCSFEIPDIEPKNEGKIVGLDIGIKSIFTTSDGQHGHDLTSINKKLERRVKGSKGFREAQTHRKNFINQSINRLNLQKIKQVNVERLNFMGREKSRFLLHWSYADIFAKLNRLCEEHGVRVQQVNSAFSSQKCSACGETDKRSRKGKNYKCCHCGNAMDSDLNAALNLRSL